MSATTVFVHRNGLSWGLATPWAHGPVGEARKPTGGLEAVADCISKVRWLDAQKDDSEKYIVTKQLNQLNQLNDLILHWLLIFPLHKLTASYILPLSFNRPMTLQIGPALGLLDPADDLNHGRVDVRNFIANHLVHSQSRLSRCPYVCRAEHRLPDWSFGH